eukprot:snap_masked-scaffold_3-processed-gene-3.24-mRNA-1 protein AED:1.00 eAED:1.00 QI:0/-1/0/0/-1/1/1/0/309
MQNFPKKLPTILGPQGLSSKKGKLVKLPMNNLISPEERFTYSYLGEIHQRLRVKDASQLIRVSREGFASYERVQGTSFNDLFEKLNKRSKDQRMTLRKNGYCYNTKGQPRYLRVQCSKHGKNTNTLLNDYNIFEESVAFVSHSEIYSRNDKPQKKRRKVNRVKGNCKFDMNVQLLTFDKHLVTGYIEINSDHTCKVDTTPSSENKFMIEKLWPKWAMRSFVRYKMDTAGEWTKNSIQNLLNNILLAKSIEEKLPLVRIQGQEVANLISSIEREKAKQDNQKVEQVFMPGFVSQTTQTEELQLPTLNIMQ